MLQKTYKQQLEKMLAREDFKGKGLLRQVIWMNEVKPLYKVGDAVKFSSRGLQVYGNNVSNFIGRITEITLWPREKIVHYQITFETVAGTNITKHTAYCNENSGEIKGKVRYSQNKITRLTEDSDCVNL